MCVFRLLRAEENRSTVQTEIKKSICSLIFEINKKGKMLINHLEVWLDLLQSYDTVKHLTRLLLHMMQNCTVRCGGGLWNIACLQVDCFYPQAVGAYPQAVRTLQMFTYSYFPGCNKGSRECLTKTTGRHRLSIQTLGLRHQLHQMGHGKERGRGPFVLQTSGKACLKWRYRITFMFSQHETEIWVGASQWSGNICLLSYTSDFL